MNTYIISFEADHFRKRLIHDTLSDNVPEVARANQEMTLANDDIKAGVLAMGGKVIELGASDEGRVQIPADRLPDFQKIIETYAQRLDSSVSVGVGEKLSESAKALVAAKLRGGNKIVTYDKTVDDTINESKKPEEGMLLKSFEPHKIQPDAPSMQTEEHSEAEAARAVANEGEELEQQKHPMEDDFHQVAVEHEKAEQAQEEDKSQDYQKIKEAVAQTLLKLRQQLPALSKLKQTNPEAFASITELAQGVVVMAREMKPLAKAESLSDIKPSADEGGTYDYSHLLKPEQQSKYRLTITHAPGEPGDYLVGKLRANLDLREGSAYNKKDMTPGFGAPASWHREESPSKVGMVTGYLFGAGKHSFVEPHSLIDENHRNQGLGTAMYAALVAHAANFHGASQVKGGIHSAPSHSVHNKIASKFGSKVKGGHVVDDDDNEEGDHDNYHYALNKSEADEDNLHDLYFTVPSKLDKATLSEIKGKPTNKPTVFDYSHLLPEDIQKTHTLKVHTKLNPATIERYFTAVFDRKGSRSKFPHGKVTAYIVGKRKHAIEPHSQLDKSYRGKGIGKAMYKALFSHAINKHGISRVEGSPHSADAHKVQQSIAKEFGIKVVGSHPIDQKLTDDNELPYGSYHFTYKGEIPSGDDGKLHPVYFLADEEIKKSDSDWDGTTPLSKTYQPIENLAAEWAGHAGLPYQVAPSHIGDESVMRQMADHYENTPDQSHNPDVQAAYQALKKETLQQYQFLKSKGYRFRLSAGNATPHVFPEKPFSPHEQSFHWVDDSGNPMNGKAPYKSQFGNLYNDIGHNKNLVVFSGGAPHPNHPLAEKLPFSDPLGTYNNVFRAVHDVMGHGLGVERYQKTNEKAGVLDFGPHGEDHAYRAQSYTYSPLARAALATETRGQNAAFHFGANGQHNRSNPSKAKYPEQKIMLMPQHLVDYGITNPTDHGSMAKSTTDGESGWWHGTPSGSLQGAHYGLHVGTKEAARQALTAKIGHPVDGTWDGTRKYGEVKLAGKNTLKARGEWPTGYNVNAPEDDYYPHQHPKGFPVFSDKSPVSAEHKPNIFQVQIVGAMTNTPQSPYEDFKANGYMAAAVKKGTAKRGYYYRNMGEDSGSISAVVPPGGAHLKIVDALSKSDKPKVFKEKGGGFVNELSIPSKNHPDRKVFDKNFMSSMQDRYGDKGKVKAIPIETTREGNSGMGVVNKPRYNLYVTMLRHGDEIPPIVAQHVGGNNYQIVDGTHRLYAAKKLGHKQINAYILNNPDKVKKNDDDLDTLEKGAMQRLHPFNPIDAKNKSVTTREGDKRTVDSLLNERIFGGSHTARTDLGQADISEAARQRGLHKLHSMTEVRKGKDGKREFALYRGVGNTEKMSAGRFQGHFFSLSHSSWTPKKEIAKKFAREGQGLFFRAWIPENAIKHVLPQFGGPLRDGYPPPSSVQSEEHEIIVAPGKYENCHPPRVIKSEGDQFSDEVEESKSGGPLEKEEECGEGCCEFDHDQLSSGINYEMSNGLSEKDAAEAAMDNLAQDPDFYKGKTLKKEAMTSHHFKAMPVGTLVNGKLKVRHADGRAGWKGVRAGMIQGQERGAALFGHNSHPVSSREPSSK